MQPFSRALRRFQRKRLQGIGPQVLASPFGLSRQFPNSRSGCRHEYGDVIAPGSGGLFVARRRQDKVAQRDPVRPGLAWELKGLDRLRPVATEPVALPSAINLDAVSVRLRFEKLPDGACPHGARAAFGFDLIDLLFEVTGPPVARGDQLLETAPQPEV